MRPSRALIDLGALRANCAQARRAQGARLVAVLKANAYGHGAAQCAAALQGEADAFAVAFVEEAVSLRAAGIAEPILVLEGVFDQADLQLALQHGCWLVVHQESQLRLLETLDARHRMPVWLKVDSGMHRAGVAPQQLQALWQRLRACPCVSEITLMTHLASADDPSQPSTLQQLAAFESACDALPGPRGPRSIANSAGILEWPAARQDWGRAGLMLYGVHPVAPVPAGAPPLRAVMRLQSQVFAERWVETGQAVGYGGMFVAPRPTRVGLVAIGYADGYPRSTPNGTPVAVGEHITRTIGRVSMDMLTVDLTDLPQEGIGSTVELWGDKVRVETVAAAAGTIAYELLCHVRRVPFVYQDSGLHPSAGPGDDAKVMEGQWVCHGPA